MKYLPEPKDYHKYWYIDVEADSLWPTTLWVLCASRMDQDEVHSFVGLKEIRRFFDELRSQEVYFVGHNALSYDAVHTGRLAGGHADVTNTVDSLVLGYLYNPGLPGGHSLASWGDRYQFPKGEFNDWSKYSLEMDKYCQRDVKLGKKVIKGLWVRMRKMGYSELSCAIEHEIRVVLDEQQRNGWYFDIPGAQALVSHLRSEQAGLEGSIRDLFPSRLKVVGTYNRRYKKDGGDFESYLRHCRDYPEIQTNEDGTYSTLEWNEFNIGSPKQRIERLLELGYEPVNYTEKGNPKVDEESLIAFAESSGHKAIQAIANWLVLQGRASMVDGWLNNVDYVDQCMHGRIMTCAANSRRMIHSSPNTANIPKAKAKVKYGIECRRLWKARPGRLQVGYDASGLEMRMFAEYLDNEAARELFTTGDPHLNNTRNLGLADEMRDLTVKNGFYAYLYGAGDPKLGRTLKPELQGRLAKEYGIEARAILEQGTPGLAKLVADIKDEYQHTGGILKTLDGGFVRCHSASAALNYKLQSGGAILMKVAAIDHHNHIKKMGYDAFMVGNIHDEIQLDSDPKVSDLVGLSGVRAIEIAGEILGCKTQFTGAYKVGANWAECH